MPVAGHTRGASSSKHPVAEKIVRHIGELYRIESHLRENPGTDRAVYRREHASKHLEKIKTALDVEKPRQLPQSAFGKAINYTHDRWDALTLYLEYSRLEIDNNLVENAIRPTAIGKKNFLFFGSPESGQTSAVLYSLIETCGKSASTHRTICATYSKRYRR